MSCLQEKDLSELADNHITAQKANIANQRSRLGEIGEELKQFKSSSNSDPIKISEAENAIADLEYHLNGRVKRSVLEIEAAELRKSNLNPDRLKKIEDSLRTNDEIIKDPDLKTAEERAEVMAAIYKQRSQFVFEDSAHDKDKDGNPIPRYASVFGVPTVKKMLDSGQKEIAEDLMLRSVSMVAGGESTRNPSDYLEVKGMEVKKSLSDGIEHHHIYNNVYVDKNGKVAPNSVRYFLGKTGEVEMQVIPEYYNSAKHGRNTQFIELMDGAHSGDDTATHLHYYKFSESESTGIKEKIQSKVEEIRDAAQLRSPKLQAELKQLQERKENPAQYEDKLLGTINKHDEDIAKLSKTEALYTTADSRGVMRKNKNLSEDDEKELQDVREQKKAIAKAKDKVQKSLEEHRSFVSAEADIKQWSKEAGELEVKAKAIKLNARFPTDEYPDKASAESARKLIYLQIRELKSKAQETKKMLREKGSIDQQIRDKQTKLMESEKLANLSASQALEIYDKTNGYFHFDKGHQESQDYSKSRPRMNAEIHKHNVRETIEVLESESKNPIESLQEIARKSYKRNLSYNLETLVNKAAGTLE